MSIPCRSSYAQDKNRYLNRTAHLAVRNSTDFPINITLYHPDSQTAQGTWTVPSGNFDWVPQPGYIIADDWGIQVNHECIYYLGEVASYGMGGGNIPVYTLTWAYVGTIEGSFSCSLDPTSANWKCELSDEILPVFGLGPGRTISVDYSDKFCDQIKQKISKVNIEIMVFNAPSSVKGNFKLFEIAFSEEKKGEFLAQKEPGKQRLKNAILETFKVIGL